MEFKEFATDYLTNLKKNIDEIDLRDIDKIIGIILNAHNKNKQIFILGNGGSAATSSHFATDLGKGTVKDFSDKSEKRMKVISLTDNIPLITAYGNDLNFDDIFAEQLNNLVCEGDIVIGISASGNSENVIKAIQLATNKKAITIGLCGFSGGKLKKISDYCIYIKNDHYGIVEDVHLTIAHLISYYIKKLKSQ